MSNVIRITCAINAGIFESILTSWTRVQGIRLTREKCVGCPFVDIDEGCWPSGNGDFNTDGTLTGRDWYGPWVKFAFQVLKQFQNLLLCPTTMHNDFLLILLHAHNILHDCWLMFVRVLTAVELQASQGNRGRKSLAGFPFGEGLLCSQDSQSFANNMAPQLNSTES